jgi:hypothetical protein
MKNMRLLNMVPELKFKKILQVSEKQLGQNLHSIEKNYAVQKVQLDQSIKLVKKQLEILEWENRPGLAIPRISSSSFSNVMVAIVTWFLVTKCLCHR